MKKNAERRAVGKDRIIEKTKDILGTDISNVGALLESRLKERNAKKNKVVYNER